MLVAISVVDAAPARGDVHARMQVTRESAMDVSADVRNSSTGGSRIDGRHWFERRASRMAECFHNFRVGEISMAHSSKLVRAIRQDNFCHCVMAGSM